MTETATRPTHCPTLTIADRGPGRRLDAEDRAQLTSWLKQAGRDHAAVVLLRVDADAWAHRALPEDPVDDATAIGAGPHALLRALEAASFPVVVHAQGQVSELGLAALLAADVRVLAPGATLAFDGSTAPSLHAAGLPAVVRQRDARAADLLWTGAVLTTAEANARGLVSEVPEVDRAEELAAAIASAPGSASVLRRSLRADGAAQLAERLEYDAWLAVAAGSRR